MAGRIIMSSATVSRECLVHIVLTFMVLMLVMSGLREGGGGGGVVDALSQVPDLSELGNAWPKGTYAIPVMGAGGKCPGGSGYEDEEEWRAGQLVQDVVHERRAGSGVGGVGIGTAEGDGMDGIVGGREEYALTVAREASESREQARNSFCTKTAPGEYSATEFMPGRYCLYKKHDCPTGFEEGWIQLDHTQATTVVSSSGVLPDGSYDNNLTILITFCCRTDGSPTVGIRLPDVRPFALLRLGHSPCQAVENMDATDGWSTLEGVATVSDGLHPEWDVGGGGGGDHGGDLEVDAGTSSNRTRVWTCVYRPRNCSGRCLAAFLDVLFVCFVVGVIVLVVCVQLRKRCASGKKRGARSGGGALSASSTTKQLHFFYDSDEDDDEEEERAIGYEPLLPFYHRRRCPVGRDHHHGELGLRRPCVGGRGGRGGADSRGQTTTVLVTRLPTQPSTDDDDGDDSDEEDDEDDDEEEEEIAWDVSVFVQLPHESTGGKDEVVVSSSVGGATHAGGRGSPPPPYEEATAVAAAAASLSGGMTEPSPASVSEEDATLVEQEKTQLQQEKQAQ